MKQQQKLKLKWPYNYYLTCQAGVDYIVVLAFSHQYQSIMHASLNHMVVGLAMQLVIYELSEHHKEIKVKFMLQYWPCNVRGEGSLHDFILHSAVEVITIVM